MSSATAPENEEACRGAIHLAFDQRSPASTAGMGMLHVVFEEKSDKTLWKAEQIYGGLHQPGPDANELRARVADDTELGERVAKDFLSTGRCPLGALDRVFFDRARRMYPDSDPDNITKRKAEPGSKCLCQLAHFHPLPPGNGGVHSAPPKGEPLTGPFWGASFSRDVALPTM
jgi:hypothetical protein